MWFDFRGLDIIGMEYDMVFFSEIFKSFFFKLVYIIPVFSAFVKYKCTHVQIKYAPPYIRGWVGVTPSPTAFMDWFFGFCC